VLKWLIRFGACAAVVAAVIWIAREALKLWVDGPDVKPSTEPWPQVVRNPAPTPAATRPDTVLTASSTPARPAEAPAGGSPARPGKVPPPGAKWVPPDSQGDVPGGHPVKAKLRSRLYHLPGMVAYARTHPDRCYATPEDAEADGFKRAQR
jgi:hypothetical protein